MNKYMKRIPTAVLCLMIMCVICMMCGCNKKENETNKSENERYSDALDLNKEGVKLGCIAGTTPEQIYIKQFPKAERVYVNNVTDNAMLLESGKSDGFVVKSTYMEGILEEHSSFVMMPEPLSETECGFFLAKSKRGKLNVCCNSDLYPNCYVKDGKLTGLYIEVTNQFCMEYGYTPVYSDVSFASCTAGITGGRYDLCASETAITDERKVSVNSSAHRKNLSSVVKYLHY